ncbi:MAG: DUF3871 family protein [Spirosomaceae bacterium]|jgi:hypothetical protein|nr:DUF3871 family protein [Spirosomataceae bacterium]
MELTVVNKQPIINFEDTIFGSTLSTSKPFIEANTIPVSLQEMQQKHIIPVFVKDNEPLISHIDFIESVEQVVHHLYSKESILMPSIRVSHPIKGRIPEARYKPAKELLEHEQTLYYERMAFVIEIPTIHETIDGNLLTLSVGGVKAYNLDNLYSRKGAEEVFKIFIGFQNKVCTNLCVWSDGYTSSLKVRSIKELSEGILQTIADFKAERYLKAMGELTNYCLSENQFAHLVGKCRLYPFLPSDQKKELPALLFGDTQTGFIARDYYRDDSFCRNTDGSISLWKLYNLFTGVNKSSYIDTFLERGINAFEFTNGLVSVLKHGQESWFLS